VTKLREQGASDDDVYRLRAAAFSPEAANRLAQLDREEAEWRARIVAYKAQRPTAGDETALQQLRDKYFSGDEQRRLGAYE
jgi:lipase chaperone LimK